MTQKERPDVRCARIADGQHGVLERTQALACGLTPRRIDHRVTAGLWVAVHPEVYRITGSGSSWLQQVSAACLWAGPEAATSHRSAARLWGLRGLWPPLVELTSPRDAPAPDRHVVFHCSQYFEPQDVTNIDLIPVTTVSRTVLDLGAVVRPDKVGVALDDALRRGSRRSPSCAAISLGSAVEGARRRCAPSPPGRPPGRIGPHALRIRSPRRQDHRSIDASRTEAPVRRLRRRAIHRQARLRISRGEAGHRSGQLHVAQREAGVEARHTSTQRVESRRVGGLGADL